MVSSPITDRLSATELGAWRGFLRAHALLVRELDGELQAQHDLPLTQYEVLITLADAADGRLRMTELADAVLLTQSGVTRLVDRLARAGLVERARCESDRRGAFAVITDAGRRRVAEARPTHRAGIRRRFLAAFDDSELRRLAGYWERVGGGEPNRVG